MKRGLLVLFLALLAGAAAYHFSRQQCACQVRDHGGHDGNTRLPELEWLQQELKLSDEQFGRVEALHRAYKPTCESLCEKVSTARARVSALAADAGKMPSPELDAALQAQALLRAECQKAMLRHLRATADVMTPDQARHYLETMVPQVLEGDAAHAGD